MVLLMLSLLFPWPKNAGFSGGRGSSAPSAKWNWKASSAEEEEACDMVEAARDGRLRESSSRGAGVAYVSPFPLVFNVFWPVIARLEVGRGGAGDEGRDAVDEAIDWRLGLNTTERGDRGEVAGRGEGGTKGKADSTEYD